MDLSEMGWGGMVWTGLTLDQDSKQWMALVNTAMNLQVP
jgi:hypothetical protein